jgi:hypothetical protein
MGCILGIRSKTEPSILRKDCERISLLTQSSKSLPIRIRYRKDLQTVAFAQVCTPTSIYLIIGRTLPLVLFKDESIPSLFQVY